MFFYKIGFISVSKALHDSTLKSLQFFETPNFSYFSCSSFDVVFWIVLKVFHEQSRCLHYNVGFQCMWPLHMAFFFCMEFIMIVDKDKFVLLAKIGQHG